MFDILIIPSVIVAGLLRKYEYNDGVISNNNRETTVTIISNNPFYWFINNDQSNVLLKW